MAVFTLTRDNFAQQTPADRLSATLFIAFLIHLVGIFLLGFEYQSKTRVNTTMDIILVQSESKTEPEEATFLAQANQDGGGDVDDNVTATTPEIAPFPDNTPQVVVTAAPTTQAMSNPNTTTAELTVDNAEQQVVLEKTENPETSDNQQGQQTETLEQQEIVDAQTLLTQMTQELASIQSTLDDRYQAHEKRPRHRHVSPRTKKYHFAHYLKAWENKIEEVALLNFPDEIRRRHLSGKVEMDVAINADGTIYEIRIIDASEYTALDDAAKRIARLAAPFMPFSKDLRKDVDVLHITRTWEFSGDATLGIEDATLGIE